MSSLAVSESDVHLQFGSSLKARSTEGWSLIFVKPKCGFTFVVNVFAKGCRGSSSMSVHTFPAVSEQTTPEDFKVDMKGLVLFVRLLELERICLQFKCHLNTQK